ncbi:MAG: class I SAM-dependent methyltransferase [Candidatus Margulisbacteria bacterium]|nr:class I SAM-dependent methyltransferase [Candidatus Margulisiibacteriota bacterium]
MAEKKESQRPTHELTYGETPYVTIDAIFKHIPHTEFNTFYDLGCGKGRVVFYVNARYKLKSIGVDVIPTFITVASKIASVKNIKGVQFILKDFLKLDLKRKAIVLVCPTCLDKPTIASLFKRLETLPKDSIVITNSVPIQSNTIECTHTLEEPFSWGRSLVYIHKII